MQSTRFAVYQKVSANTCLGQWNARPTRARCGGMRATRELLRAFGIVASSPCRTAARHGSHRHTSWWRASTFAAGGTERPRWNPQRAHDAAALPPCVRVSSLTDARGDFDGLVPLLVEKIARSIRAVDGRRPVAVVTSPNDRDVLGMTLRRLADRPPWRGASSRHRRREVNGSTEYNDASDDDAPTRVFTAMDAALGPHRHGEHASSFAVDAHAAMTTQLAATRKKAFAYDAKFAGDVDVDEIALRCAKRDWDPGDLEHGGVEHDGARTRGVAGADFSSPGADFSPSPFGAVVVAWDGRDDSIFNRYLSSPVPRESSARPHASARGDELTPRGWMRGAMLDVVAVDAPAMLADFGDYGEVPSLAPESVARLRAADVVVLHHVSLLPSSAAVEAVQRRVVDAVKSAPGDEKSAPPRVPPGPVLVRTESRCEKTERLHRYAGASPAHEWTPPPSRLRGARVLGMTACRGGDGRRRGFKALLRSLVAPADASDVNGY